MGKSERNKGMAAEREVRDIINSLSSFKVHKTPHSGALTWLKGDLIGLPDIHIEVKRQERIQIDAWMRQAADQADAGQVPAVVYRKSRTPWHICMPLVDFIQLLDRLHAAVAFREYCRLVSLGLADPYKEIPHEEGGDSPSAVDGADLHQHPIREQPRPGLARPRLGTDHGDKEVADVLGRAGEEGDEEQD